MSNPTLLVENFDDSSGDFTVVAPERYDGGLWTEEATTNTQRNPYGVGGTTGYAVAANNTLSRSASIAFPVDDLPADAAWITSTLASATLLQIDSPSFALRPAASVGQAWTLSGWIYHEHGSNVTVTLDIRESAGAGFSANGTTTVSVPTHTPTFVSWTRTLSGGSTTNAHGRISMTGPSWFGVFGSQFEQKAYATSLCPMFDEAGTILAGYAFTGTAHQSTSTRAASSASVTIDEPVSVACWYREAYSGAKAFAYLEPLGTLGTYGDISYAAGDLTISTTRNLVIGPFAAFDRELTAQEQANLARTQSWDEGTVLGGTKIIMPLSRRRRR